MYAVIQENGSRQHRVVVGQKIKIEKLSEEVGSQIEFDKVLLVVDGSNATFGQPFIQGAKVTAKVVEAGRDDKIIVTKFKRRKHHMKRQGHRQHYLEVEIVSIAA